MYVIKRDGRQQRVQFDKITGRISKLCYLLDVDPAVIAQKVILGVTNGISAAELDELAAQTAAYMTSEHPHYGELAARIAISNLHKSTTKSFSQLADQLYHYVNPETKLPSPLLSTQMYEFIQTNADGLNSAIIHDRDYKYDYFGFKTLCKSYLLKLNGKIVERPQMLLMRVSCCLHMGDVEKAIESYNFMSNRFFTHASPTLFNAGTEKPQLSSCYLLTIKDDSIEGIYSSLKDCANISKLAGGIGMAVHDIRALGSYIRGTNGVSNGLIPMLRVFNNTARYVDQGGGKRKGAFSIYLEPWHADIFAFLDLKKNTGIEENRARDLFYALWIPDLFMQRVEKDAHWTLFCPNEAPGLADCWGQQFTNLYESYEAQPKKIRKQIKARELWQAILEAQTETGVPYMLYKDACNSKSNQQHLGTIRCSNLCTEIVEYTSPQEIAVCNLASIALNMFVHDGQFDFQLLFDITKVVCNNLNKVIDVNYYPVPEAEYSNLKHRPIGIGVQGLADAFILMRFPFDSREAALLNRDIFETIYFGACTASMELSKKDGPYPSYQGSPMSKGQFQFDLWNVKPSPRWNWDELRTNILQHGIRNSLMVAPMPTASTSQILGNNECFEPYTSNLYVRRTLAGEFIRVSKHLLKDLMERNLWNAHLKNKLIADKGSVQNIEEIPQDLKDLYKTVWEIKTKVIMDMAADRGAFICQSQSLNVHMTDINFAKLTSMHFYGWKKGLKTGMYYLRSKSAVDAIPFTVDQSQLKRKHEDEPDSSKRLKTDSAKQAELTCSLDNRDACTSCGS